MLTLLMAMDVGVTEVFDFRKTRFISLSFPVKSEPNPLHFQPEDIARHVGKGQPVNEIDAHCKVLQLGYRKPDNYLTY